MSSNPAQPPRRNMAFYLAKFWETFPHSSPESFALFTKLPADLQDKIWEMTMRGNTPAFHAFHFEPQRRKNNMAPFEYDSECTIYGFNCEASHKKWVAMNTCTPVTVTAGIFRPKGLRTHILTQGKEGTALQPQDLEPLCWHHMNRSMYLHDAGLWTACKGSRLAMTGAHVFASGDDEATSAAPKNENAISPGGPQLSASQDPETPIATKHLSAAITGSFQSHGENLIFHIAKQDVVLVQLDWPIDKVSLTPEQLDFKFGEFTRSICKALQGVDNLGIHYEGWMFECLKKCADEPYAVPVREQDGTVTHLKWKKNVQGPLLEFFKAVTSSPCGPRIWLVDYTLKRDKAPKRSYPASQIDARGDGVVFKGKGCRFVEVKWQDESWVSSIGVHHGHAHNLLGALITSIEMHSPSQHWVKLLEWICYERFGVLAYEMD